MTSKFLIRKLIYAHSVCRLYNASSLYRQAASGGFPPLLIAIWTVSLSLFRQRGNYRPTSRLAEAADSLIQACIEAFHAENYFLADKVLDINLSQLTILRPPVTAKQRVVIIPGE